MAKRNDINSILILGAGPIVIGQACEFDYSGVQACRALHDEGYRVVLVNSNPATIMTDPTMADATYIEPVRPETVARIIEKERPDALLPTMGGQTALNCALELERTGVLACYGVEMIGASADAIDKAENRSRFDQAMKKIGLECPRSGIARSKAQAREVMKQVGLPCIIRPSFTMGGSGGGIAHDEQEFEAICTRGLSASPCNELLIDESLIGWKEFEMEVVRDKEDNCIIVCTIENLDPMGVHTGDSITVAPAQTLTDKEYQKMRNAALAVLREIGVETGGANVQFGINPETGRMVVIEMNPRVSRSSALASKATGFPIAKVAARLAVGYSLAELRHEMMGESVPASFEPTLDYVVTKLPRFDFEKFPSANAQLTTQMKSVGEVMAVGRNFQESLQKALRGLETGVAGLEPRVNSGNSQADTQIRQELHAPSANRLLYIADAFRQGFSQNTVFELTHIDPWFLTQIEDLVQEEQRLSLSSLTSIDREDLRRLKSKGFSDNRLGQLLGVTEQAVRSRRLALGLRPVFKRIDSCAAEFATVTAYLYSSYDEECEAAVSTQPKVVILGGGPNRIGQGIEFDYCCVHAAMALREQGFETIMVNCNPETVSTDYDISDRLYFESVTLEDILNIVDIEKPEGVIVQYGGQTPLKLSLALQKAGVRILGTSPEAIDKAEDRDQFQSMICQLGLRQPINAMAGSLAEAMERARTIGYPLIVRPSYVLGGRAMEIVNNEQELNRAMRTDRLAQVSPAHPVLLDSYLTHAIEVDVDAVCDGESVVIGALMQHVEHAGVHSGDSSCSLPPHDLPEETQRIIKEQVRSIALELGVVGLMNVQMALQDGELYVIEVNPRAARTVPFVSKCIGVSLAKVGAKVMAGTPLRDLLVQDPVPAACFVKAAVFPFSRFPDTDPILGPEMKSTGEVMGVGDSFPEAYAKAQLGVHMALPEGGRAILSLRDRDKPQCIILARLLKQAGFELIATRGTANALLQDGMTVEVVNKVQEGKPHLVDMIAAGKIDLVVNTTEGYQAIADSATIRVSASAHNVLYATTVPCALAIAEAILFGPEQHVRRLQDLHAGEQCYV
ncbi:MAG: carbamoyl-phosphate synthase large subunit [Kistimonas sp.]|nr:carbamoyl-phosphate synthase large subunit [Kistimonas sp.]